MIVKLHFLGEKRNIIFATEWLQFNNKIAGGFQDIKGWESVNRILSTFTRNVLSSVTSLTQIKDKNPFNFKCKMDFIYE
jgi:hypothetical protein